MPTVEIRRNSDGLTRAYEDKFLWEDGSEYLWADGNYSCDCNRFLFFARAAGEEPAWNDGLPCTDGRFSVRISDADKVLYEDDGWATSADTA